MRSLCERPVFKRPWLRTIREMNQTLVRTTFASLLMGFLALSPAGTASTGEQYYSVTLEVSDRSERARSRAISRALAIVLRRFTGQVDLPEDEVIAEALARADSYALRFGYERLGEGGSALTVQFDPRSVRQLIEEAGLRVWSLERPLVMAWVLIEDSEGEQVLDAASLGEIPEAMRRSASEHGLPLALPLMDMDERLSVHPMHLRGLFLDELREASRRYKSRFILVGRVRASNKDHWTATWTLAQPGAPLSELEVEGRGGEVARAGMGFVLAELSSRFALDTDIETRVRLSVEGVHELVDYAELFEYLRQLDGVQRAQLLEVTSGLLTLDVWLATSWEGFLDLLSQQRRLTPVFVVDLQEGEQRMVWRSSS